MTTTPATKVLGLLSLVTVAAVAVLALFVVGAPEVVDNPQGDVYRLLYVHVPSAYLAYVSFGVTALASMLWLVKRTRTDRWDLLAEASAEVGVVFTGLTLGSGMIWGKPTWGTWWVWDARLTSTAMLFVVWLGYLALRRSVVNADDRARLSAVVALLGVLLVPIVNRSVEWWRTLHQEASLTPTSINLEPEMTTVLLLSLVGFTLTYSWLVMHRFRLGRVERFIEAQRLETAIAQREEEARAELASQPAGSI